MLTLLRRDDSGCWPPKAQELLQTLTVMAQHEDPSAFFSFADDSAGILRSTGLPFPGESRVQHALTGSACHSRFSCFCCMHTNDMPDSSCQSR